MNNRYLKLAASLGKLIYLKVLLHDIKPKLIYWEYSKNGFEMSVNENIFSLETAMKVF